MAKNEKHGIPALMSFFIIGLGQLIKGHFLKGIVMHVCAWIAFIASFFVIGIPFFLFIWGNSIYDAYNSNSKW